MQVVVIAACLYCVAVILIGPPFLARQNPLTWKLNFQENVERLASQEPSEEAFISALRKRGFSIRIPSENPITYQENGGLMIRYVDRDRSYTTYAEFVQAHERFQAALPEGYVERPRGADTSYGFLVCSHVFYITWRLSGADIVDLKAAASWDCV